LLFFCANCVHVKQATRTASFLQTSAALWVFRAIRRGNHVGYLRENAATLKFAAHLTAATTINHIHEIQKLSTVCHYFFLFLLLLSFFKSAAVIFLRGGATAANFFCFGLYLEYGITTSPAFPIHNI
jgi:hypothetical protein